jgi:hypothetical protein
MGQAGVARRFAGTGLMVLVALTAGCGNENEPESPAYIDAYNPYIEGREQAFTLAFEYPVLWPYESAQHIPHSVIVKACEEIADGYWSSDAARPEFVAGCIDAVKDMARGEDP